MLGITEKGILYKDQNRAIDLDTRFRQVKESGIFDYYDKTPEDPNLLDEYLCASDKYDIPILAGGWTYQLGSDELLNILNEDRDFIIEEINNISR